MNIKEFTHLLLHPETITTQDTVALQQIIDQFPYFQTARAIQLKGLKDQESYTYNTTLKKVASFTTNRTILFQFITSKKFIQNTSAKHITSHSEPIKNIKVNAVQDISINTSKEIDEALKKQIENSKRTLNQNLFQPKTNRNSITNFELDTTQNIEETATKPKPTSHQESPQQVLNIGKPLQFNIEEKHSFTEWLQLSKVQPIQRDKEENKTTKRNEKFAIIDKFIQENPKIIPTKETHPSINLAEQKNLQPEVLMTETLAQIYLEQEKFDKALQAYKILSLKYPEKSGFFADKIKAIEKIQEKNNTK